MADKSKIEWTDATWNPITGCTKVSAGCKNCYAEREFPRVYPGRSFSDIQFHEDRLDQPLHWKRPRRIFVNSMSDLFHEKLSDLQIARIFLVMAEAKQHVFQVLTKRPERMREFLSDVTNPLENVWLGVSCEDQKTADERIPLLLQTPATVRWISYEPALGSVDFCRIDYSSQLNETLKDAAAHANIPLEESDLGKSGTAYLDVLNGKYFDGWDSGNDGERLDWIVIGGESGPKARPFNVHWAREVIAQCKAAGVPCFVKQLGSLTFSEHTETRTAQHFNETIELNVLDLRDRKGGDMAEWPEDLRVREYPCAS